MEKKKRIDKPSPIHSGKGAAKDQSFPLGEMWILDLRKSKKKLGQGDEEWDF